MEARSLLSRLFRSAGLRIVNDRTYKAGEVDVTLDGYDPALGIGFEYVAPQERGTDLSIEEGRVLAEQGKILVLGGGSLDELEVAARAFLEAARQDINPEP